MAKKYQKSTMVRAMDKNELTSAGQFLEKSLANIEAYDRYETQQQTEKTLHVTRVANTLITAYEQLRSVAENIEDHMLTQAAIMRFYRRNLIFTQSSRKLAKELVIELTQAGYLENDTVPLKKIDELENLITSFIDLRGRLSTASTPARRSDKWILELLSVKSEQLLNNPIRTLSFAHFAHNYFSQSIDYSRVVKTDDAVPRAEYPKLLYIAIHKELLKSNDANARSGLFDLYSVSMADVGRFIEFNTIFDKYCEHDATAALARFVTQNGAPLRIIKSSFFEKRDEPHTVTLENESKTLSYLDAQIDRIYKQTKRVVNQGIVKSIMFLLLARALVGVLIEVPYDTITTGSVAVLPLLINLIFPAAFMVITVLTFKKPGDQNKEALKNYIGSMLYTKDQNTLTAFKYRELQKKNYVFEIVLGITFVLAFYLIISRLTAFNYNYLQGFMFLVFFSTANFLGYRLTLQTKELEYIATNQGFIAMIRDVLYFPFIFVGKRIARRSQKFSLVANVLDIVIDLPLKTVVRLVRQWLGFIQSKKDELV